MSEQDRPRREYRSAQHEGNPMSAQDRPRREHRSAKHEDSPMSPRQFWIGVVSKDHVDRATAGGFAQVNHGKAGPLERMRAGDGFAFYSPRTSYPDGKPLQAFTAIGRVRTGAVYQAEMEDGDHNAAEFRVSLPGGYFNVRGQASRLRYRQAFLRQAF